MQTIRLERGEWSFDESEPLGPAGGFGEVFRGSGPAGTVAVKRLKLSAGAASHREMKIGAALADRTLEHVVPILDFGQDAESDRYFLVMPLCDYSLQDRLRREATLDQGSARETALAILAGLEEASDIVHRDLKPGNILWHEGRWKIADFGIAKFVEDATSLESLRTSLTPSYAAPEQWRGERPTSATDIYALGCIFHAMITGQPPFVGDADAVREAHLHSPAPSLSGIDSRLAGLVTTMLRKPPASRPSVSRCRTVLKSAEASKASPARSALAAAGHAVSQEEAAAEAARSARQQAETERRALFESANSELRTIVDGLFDAIVAEADSVRRERDAVTLGPGRLVVEMPRGAFNMPPTAAGDPHRHGWDIASNAFLTLTCEYGQRTSYDPGVYKLGVSLIFAKLSDDPDFRWREMSFCEIFTQRSNFNQPFGLNPFDRDFQIAISNVMGSHQVAHGPWAIDGEDEPAFVDRWLNLFAKAASRELRSPSQMPPPESFFKGS